MLALRRAPAATGALRPAARRLGPAPRPPVAALRRTLHLLRPAAAALCQAVNDSGKSQILHARPRTAFAIDPAVLAGPDDGIPAMSGRVDLGRVVKGESPVEVKTKII